MIHENMLIRLQVGREQCDHMNLWLCIQKLVQVECRHSLTRKVSKLFIPLKGIYMDFLQDSRCRLAGSYYPEEV